MGNCKSRTKRVKKGGRRKGTRKTRGGGCGCNVNSSSSPLYGGYKYTKRASLAAEKRLSQRMSRRVKKPSKKDTRRKRRKRQRKRKRRRR